MGEHVVAVEVHLEGLAARLVAAEQLLLDGRLACGGHEGGQPVHVVDDLVGDAAGGKASGPAHHGGHPPAALPVGVLLAAEGRHGGVGPRVQVRAVVRAVEDDRVVGDAELVELGEQLPE